MFESLQVLLLGNNALAGWADVQALGALPALADVRLSGNPVLRSAPGGGRYEVQSPKCVLGICETLRTLSMSLLITFQQASPMCLPVQHAVREGTSWSQVIARLGGLRALTGQTSPPPSGATRSCATCAALKVRVTCLVLKGQTHSFPAILMDALLYRLII